MDVGLHGSLIRSASMVGGFAALSGVVSLDGAVSAIEGMVVPGLARWACAEATGAAYEFVRAEKDALAA